jgi:DNA-binding sugar fermentation-stimulating protein
LSDRNKSTTQTVEKTSALFPDASLRRGDKHSRAKLLVAKALFAIRGGVAQADLAVKFQIREQIDHLRQALDRLEEALDIK